ncbi:SigE family RNA polymerase sigma factor [Actinacidiphila acididurans]|uniref:SigE family RNA polymerase sigma factor n=1 Tax=Actinacidiphila acididurans TaxID=2784346 RepID=A0ABS2TS84_9ACTN|nr:SigE family RNA polymerase sigma factor [Actinacidiphila acididurans]MBM9506205.1 SigE family RNA polymerase sigma factor [Actinacidiphila acididurans]
MTQTARPTFEEYVSGRGTALLRLAYLLSGDSHLAEDLTQDVLLRVHRRWRRVATLDHPDAYVKRMLLNEYLSWRRRRSSTEVPAPADTGVPVTGADGDIGERVAMQEAAWRLLATLPRRQRAVLVLRFYEDLSDAQIAEVLGCAAATVRSQAARALATLRAEPALLGVFTGRTFDVKEA